MDAKEFRAWRERVGLTQQQFAERLRVTRTTVQNWESGTTPIPRAVDMSCEIWEHRLKQENPNLGPVTLIYSDGPMFVNPYGPRRRPAMMHQEPYPTNTAAIARVQQLWGADNFHNAFIIEESGKPLWNVVELGRVVDGSDTGAPTLPTLLRTIASIVRTNSAHFVRSGPRSPTPSESRKRQQAIEGEADRLARLANAGLGAIISNQQQIERVFTDLLALGTRAPDSLVSNVAQALVVFEQNQSPMIATRNMPNARHCVVGYRGFEISWPEIRIDSSRWTVNLSSDDPHLLARLGAAQVFNDPKSLESAIQRAKLHVDSILANQHHDIRVRTH
jgi:hypothetical protein